MSSDVIYAVRVERLSYGGLQILRVKIGRTKNIRSTLRQYKRSHADMEVLDLWKPNRDLDVSTCEKGMHDIAEIYSYDREREIFTFLQDSYEEFSKAVSQLLRLTTEDRVVQTSPTKATTTTQSVESSGGTYIIEFSDDGRTIKEIQDRSQTKAMVKATNYLIRNHGLIDNVNVPWVPGRSKAIINDVDEWEGSNHQYQKLDGGYYIDTHLNSQGKQREIKRMSEICRLDVNFKGDW